MGQQPAVHGLVRRAIDLAGVVVAFDLDLEAEQLAGRDALGGLDGKVPFAGHVGVLGQDHLGIDAEVGETLGRGAVGPRRIERLIAAVGEVPREALFPLGKHQAVVEQGHHQAAAAGRLFQLAEHLLGRHVLVNL